MSINKKERIIPKLDDNFHESIFFLEIQYKKTPLKEIKEKLINYYIKGVDYYTGTNHKDFSLYFQTKLLNIMKEQDHFEKTIERKMGDENYQEKINELVKRAKDIEINQKNTIKNDIQKQKDQFLFNLSFRKQYKKLRRYNSFRINTKDNKSKLGMNLRKDSNKLPKKNSIDLTNFNIIKSNKNHNFNKSNNNTVFSKIDNALIDFDKINTLLIIEYVKKLKQFAKLQLESMDIKTNKYLEYIKTNNELNLLYEDLPDKNDEEAKNLKSQIDMNREDWELYEKSNKTEDIIKENNIKDIIKEKNINNLDKVLDNILRKMNELIKENEIQ